MSGVFLTMWILNSLSHSEISLRMKFGQLVKKSDFFTNCPNFILKEISEWLNEFKIHIVRKTPDIVMTFNHRCVFVATFNHVRINGTLEKIMEIVEFTGLFFKHPN